tara:strand:+ start:43 stop:222 length:180 start_codon:yes stop_codon:yes gene_type:complete
MKIGDLVTVETFGVGVIVETDFDEDNRETMFKVAFFNEFLDEWFHGAHLDKLEAVKKCP